MNIDTIMGTSTQPTHAELKVALQLMMAVAETIREVGEAPSGTIYAALALADRVSLSGYQSLIANLKNAGLVREQSHLLTWIGPKI